MQKIIKMKLCSTQFWFIISLPKQTKDIKGSLSLNSFWISLSIVPKGDESGCAGVHSGIRKGYALGGDWIGSFLRAGVILRGPSTVSIWAIKVQRINQSSSWNLRTSICRQVAVQVRSRIVPQNLSLHKWGVIRAENPTAPRILFAQVQALTSHYCSHASLSRSVLSHTPHSHRCNHFSLPLWTSETHRLPGWNHSSL